MKVSTKDELSNKLEKVIKKKLNVDKLISNKLITAEIDLVHPIRTSTS